jgi:hypothetical protein
MFKVASRSRHGPADRKFSGSLTRKQTHKRDQRICRWRLAVVDRCRFALTHNDPNMVNHQIEIEMAKSFSVLF